MCSRHIGGIIDPRDLAQDSISYLLRAFIDQTVLQHDRDGDCIREATIGSRDCYRIGSLRLIVKRCAGFQLTGCVINAKRCSICAIIECVN